MSSQDGGVRLLDPSAMAKYGTSVGSDTSYDADRNPYEGGSNGLDSSQLYRRPQEQPSFWTSVFSAERFENDYKQVDSLSHSVIEEYQPVLAHAERGSSINFTPEPENTASANFWWSTFNLWNDILSSNIVSVPYFVMSLGIWLTLPVFIIYGYLTVITLDIVYKLSNKYRKKSYVELCHFALGKPGYIAACVFIFLFNYGTLVTNLLVIATNIPEILQQWLKPSIWISREYILMYVCLLFLPVSFFKNITSYTINSILSLTAVWILTGIVFAKLIYIFATHEESLPPGLTRAVGPSPLSAIGGVSFLYVCHDLSFSVFEDYKGVTRRRWTRVIFTAMILSLIPWMLTGISGFFLFGENTAANVLDNFPINDIPAIIARFALSLNVAISVPYYCFMPRISSYALLSLVIPKLDVDIFHIMSTVLIFISGFLVAIFVTDLGTFSELVGVAAIFLGLILPPLIFLRLERGAWHSPAKLTHWLILVVGVLSAIAVVATIILQKALNKNL